MPKVNPFAAAENTLREFALRFPGAVEEHPWGHCAIKVKKKMFVIMGGTDEKKSVTVKLPSSGRMALLLPFTSPTGYGLGKSGWVTSEFVSGDDVPVDRLCEWIEESYRAVAPKKLVAELDNPGEKPAPAPKKKKRKA
jgi:predicted DNA-binding protein (MmcQ/YjbR family)